TTYAQTYPYTGLPTSVTRNFNLGAAPPMGVAVPLSKTATTYCDATASDPDATPSCTPVTGSGSGVAYPPTTPLFVYPLTVVDTSYLHVGQIPQLQTPDLLTTTSVFHYDDQGNPVRTIVTTALQSTEEAYEKRTESTYGTSATSMERKRGKVT